jgi:hypothetical protein
VRCGSVRCNGGLDDLCKLHGGPVCNHDGFVGLHKLRGRFKPGHDWRGFSFELRRMCDGSLLVGHGTGGSVWELRSRDIRCCNKFDPMHGVPFRAVRLSYGLGELHELCGRLLLEHNGCFSVDELRRVRSGLVFVGHRPRRRV